MSAPQRDMNMTVVITDQKRMIALLIHVKNNNNKTIISQHDQARQDVDMKRVGGGSSGKRACFNL